MQLKKTTVSSKQSKFNFELRKSFSDKTLFISNTDLEKTMRSLNMLSEYIRSCYFDNYSCYNHNNLEKYCRLLLNFEFCNQSIIVKECQNLCKKILNNAINHRCSLKTMSLCFAMNESNYESIRELSNELMTLALGSKIKAIN